MTEKKTDDALQVLLNEYSALKPNFPETMLRECFEVEKAHQFERDRELSSNEMARIITITIEQEMGGEK
jgi:hypothetical protein